MQRTLLPACKALGSNLHAGSNFTTHICHVRSPNSTTPSISFSEFALALNKYFSGQRDSPSPANVALQ
jgi:hypothetical protein